MSCTAHFSTPSPLPQPTFPCTIFYGYGTPLIFSRDKVEPELAKHGIFGYACEAVDELVYIHPSSVLHKRKPEFVTFQELQRGKTRLCESFITYLLTATRV